MLEALVITLREGIEAALVIGIILAYLHKTGRGALNRWVYLGIGAAIAVSIAFAIVLQALNVDPENEYVEGALFTAAGILVASLVIWMWRVAKHVKQGVEKKLSTIVDGSKLRNQGLGLLGFTFFMVFREGAETVLFLWGATLGKFDFLSFVGGATGIGLAVLFAIFFIRGSLKLNLSRFFTVTSIVLLILAVKLILSGLHEFAERGLVPLTPQIMAAIGFVVRDTTSTIILLALLIAPLLVILWDARGRDVGRDGTQPAGNETPVEKRKRLATKRQAAYWRLSLVAVSLVIFFSMGWAALAAGPGYVDPQPIPTTATNGEVRIPLADLDESKLMKYSYDVDGTMVRFIVVRLADGSVATAMDACQICGAVGYAQSPDTAVCKRCNAPIALDTIGQGGGCNPLPLEASLAGGTVVIPVSELIEAKATFE